MAFRVVQLSDTHLSEVLPTFVANFEAVVDWLNELKPDLVIHTGDVVLDAPRRPEDLTFAAALHRRIEAPLLTLPGNHDVGNDLVDASNADEPAIAEAQLEVWHRAFGPDRFSAARAGWQLIGLNAQLLASDLPGAAAAWDWLATELGSSAGRPLALFLHKPLCLERLDEDERDPAYLIPAARVRLLDLCADGDLRLIGSGHIHRYRERRIDGVAHVWAPSTAFIFPGAGDPRRGEKRHGVVRYDFEADRVLWQCLTPPGLTLHVAG